MTELLAKCEVCRALLDEEDLFCGNCGREAPHHGPASQHNRTSTHNFECAGCGASMSYEAQAGTLRCPFCGSEHMNSQADRRVLAPKRAAPFRVTREQAASAMRKFLGKGFWRPGDLSERATLVKMSPVLVPYWVFRAKTHTYWTADTNQLPPFSRGDWRPISGEHHGEYEGLLVGASGALTVRETTAICPFDLTQALPPDAVDFDSVTVEQFSVMRKYARPLARDGLVQLETAACQQYVPGRARNVKVNMKVEGLASEPVLLPVWIMAYRYQEKLYRFLVNGQTGKATGAAPTSLVKVAVVSAIGVLALLTLILLLAR